MRFRFTPQEEAGCLSKAQLDENAVLEPSQGRQPWGCWWRGAFRSVETLLSLVEAGWDESSQLLFFCFIALIVLPCTPMKNVHLEGTDFSHFLSWSLGVPRS